jgi:hypothetical protein
MTNVFNFVAVASDLLGTSWPASRCTAPTADRVINTAKLHAEFGRTPYSGTESRSAASTDWHRSGEWW